MRDSKLPATDELIDVIFESLVHPFYIIDAQTYEIIKANPAAVKGRDANARTCHALTHLNPEPCDSAEHGCPLREVLATGKPAEMIHTHHDAEGNPRLFEVHGYPIYDNGKIVQMIEYSIDITDSVRAQDESEKAVRAAAEATRLKEQLIETQQKMISELSTPILEIWEGVVVLPVIGSMDSRRSREMVETLLETVSQKKARGVIIDVTGLDVIDTVTAAHFIGMVKAIRLLGAEAVISGISSSVAQTMGDLNIDLSEIVTLRSLKEGLSWFLKRIGGFEQPFGAEGG
jgi:rsbT co-antagonist protein RsbR